MRTTGNQYLKRYKESKKVLASIDAHVKVRLEKLVKDHPDALVYKKRCDEVHCKVITPLWLDNLETITRISYIVGIEKWLSEQEPVRQGKLYD